MDKRIKILYIIFFLLLIITVGEAGYYLYYTINKQSRSTGSYSTEPIQNDNLELNPTMIDERLRNPVQEVVESEDELALKSSLITGILETSKFIRKDVLKSYIITAELEGKIDELRISSPDQLRLYSDIPIFILVIKGDKGGKHQFALTQDTSTKVSTIKIINEKGDLLDIDKLNLGDRIRVKVEMDITEAKSGKSRYNWFITKI